MSVWSNSHISASENSLGWKIQDQGLCRSYADEHCSDFLHILFSAPERVRGARYTERMSITSCHTVQSYWKALIQKWAAGGTLVWLELILHAAILLCLLSIPTEIDDCIYFRRRGVPGLTKDWQKCMQSKAVGNVSWFPSTLDNVSFSAGPEGWLGLTSGHLHEKSCTVTTLSIALLLLIVTAQNVNCTTELYMSCIFLEWCSVAHLYGHHAAHSEVWGSSVGCMHSTSELCASQVKARTLFPSL